MGVRVREWKGAWWIYVDHHKKRTLRRIGVGEKAQRTAEEVAQFAASRIALGEDPFPPKTIRRKIPTLNQHAETWLASMRHRKLGTQEKYAEVMRKHWLPELGNRTLDQIARADVRGVLTAKLAQGYSQNMVELMASTIRACLNRAVEDELLNRNPAARLGKWLAGPPAGVVETFTPAQLSHVIDTAFKQLPLPQATLILLLARTGVRIGEALALQAEDVDLGRREIIVRRTWGSRKAGLGAKRFNTPKGNNLRRVDVSAQLADVLSRYLPTARLTWLFTWDQGQPMHPTTSLHSIWGPLLQQAGVSHRKPYTLRHTYASFMIQNGANLAYVKEQLGHSSIKITVDTYGHLIPGANKKAVDRLDDKCHLNVTQEHDRSTHQEMED